MKKEKITFEELALMSFLKFDRLDNMDMTVMYHMISNNFELIVDDMSSDYFISNNGTIVINNSYIDNFCKNINNEVRVKIEKNRAYKQIDGINMFEFILRKIKMIGEGAVLVDDLSNIFEPLQLAIVNRMYKEGYIREYTHSDIIYGDSYQAIKLTKRGELYLYVVDNKEQIDKFSNMLVETGCDDSLISSFLITQDLDRNINEILTVNNFMNFCHEYGLSMFKKDGNLKRKLSYSQ